MQEAHYKSVGSASVWGGHSENEGYLNANFTYVDVGHRLQCVMFLRASHAQFVVITYSRPYAIIIQTKQSVLGQGGMESPVPDA